MNVFYSHKDILVMTDFSEQNYAEYFTKEGKAVILNHLFKKSLLSVRWKYKNCSFIFLEIAELVNAAVRQGN